MKIAGIDIGLNGAIVFYDGKNIKTFNIPTKVEKINKKERKNYDIKGIKKLIKKEKPQIAVIEKIWSIPRDGRVGAFSFGYGLGVISAICELLIPEVYYVSAVKWKKHFNLNGDKRASVNLCNKLFGTDFKLKDHNEAEALLLIRYYMEVKNEQRKT